MEEPDVNLLVYLNCQYYEVLCQLHLTCRYGLLQVPLVILAAMDIDLAYQAVKDRDAAFHMRCGPRTQANLPGRAWRRPAGGARAPSGSAAVVRASQDVGDYSAKEHGDGVGAPAI